MKRKSAIRYSASAEYLRSYGKPRAKDPPGIIKAVRKKIQYLARQLGYRSNTFASNLRKKNMRIIGVIVPRLSSYFMSHVLAGMEHIASAEGYNLIISQSPETLKKEIANAQTLFNSRVDGLLVSLSCETDSIDHFELFIRKKIPLIFLDRIKEHDRCMVMLTDNYKSAYESTSIYWTGDTCAYCIPAAIQSARYMQKG